MTARVFVACFLNVCFGSSLCAQVSPKASVSKKLASVIGHKANRSSQHFQVFLLQGVWSDDVENNAIFWIEGKHVKFFDHIGDDTPEYQRVYWSVANNKLSFHYAGGNVVTDDIMKLTKDSLVLYRRDRYRRDRYRRDRKAGVVGYSRYVRLK